MIKGEVEVFKTNGAFRKRTGRKSRLRLEKPLVSPSTLNAAVTPFPVIGLGASAGGLEALEIFFKALPVPCGMALVVVTHQHSGHESLLPELLGKCTALPVRLAAANTVLAPDTVYLSHSDSYLSLIKGVLQLIKPDAEGRLQLPIDFFFRSLAADRPRQAVGIVLSGTGDDGSRGLKAIQAAGGLTLVQEPESAKFDGMPASAIAAGAADYVLPVERMPQQLLACSRTHFLAARKLELSESQELSEPMLEILRLLRPRARNDFSVYKASTLRRRIERRIHAHHLKTPQQYLRLLQENPHEIDQLFRELLIGVTHFFRDPAAFAALENLLVSKLLKDRKPGEPIRVWVPGCSTGEEAYSLAMLFQKTMEKLKKSFPLQIFATDLDPEAINFARRGLYPETIARDVRPRLLAHFFVKEDGGYQIRKATRECVILATQNALQDPPFTKLDLIACRNLLIYVKPSAQERLFSLFHYALKPGGLLFLGSSESLVGPSDSFAVLDKKWKLFMRKNTVTARVLPTQFDPPLLLSRVQSGDTLAGAGRGQKQLFAAIVDKTLLARFAPASVLVDDRGDILHIHGRTGDYLEPATGQPRLNILEMARDGLRLDLTAALRQSGAGKGEVVREGLQVKTHDGFVSVRLTVNRLSDPESVRGLLLVTFQIEPAVKATAGAVKKTGRQTAGKDSGRVSELERELQSTRETLLSTANELQSSSEEMKSTNEELQSANEELQSANEELQTVNAELKGKLDALALANDDMQNLLNSTAIATIFLDQNLAIKRFTAEATKLVKLLPSDVGRPIGDLTSNLDYDQLQVDAEQVLQTLGVVEKEVQTKTGEWRQVRIHPYRTTANVIEGLVVTFMDINRVKRAEQQARHARDNAESIVATVRQPLLVLDENLCVVSANAAFHRVFKTSPRAVERQSVYELGRGEWNIPALRKLLEEVLPHNTSFEDYKVEQDFSGLGRKTLMLNARRLKRETGEPEMILLAIEEVAADDVAVATKPARRTKK